MYRIPLRLKWKGQFWLWAVERYLILCLRLLLNLLWGLQVCVARVPWDANGEERVGGFCCCPWELCHQIFWGRPWVCTGAVLGGGWVYCRGIALGWPFPPTPAAGLDFSLEPSCWRKGGSCSSDNPVAVLGACLMNLRAKMISVIPQKEAPHPRGEYSSLECYGCYV